MKNILDVKRENFIETALDHIENSHTVLDIGCGIVPHNYAHHDVYLACEPFGEYIDVLKKNRAEGFSPLYLDTCFLIRQTDWAGALDLMEGYSVDTVYLIDVIEHLPKEEGAALLQRTLPIARKQIVIFTPSEYIEQKLLPGNKDAWGLNGISWQEHKSVWTPDDFRDDTWQCVVCKDFHQTNNIGEKLKKPVGAFWAIKTCCNIEKNSILEKSDIAAEYKKEVRERFSHITNVLQENTNLKAEKRQLQEEKARYIKILNEIYDSKGWKFLEKYRRIKRYLLGD